MPLLGAHMSIAGGYYKAVEAAREAGCDCVQVFTKNNNQWRAKAITPDEAERFRASLAELKIAAPLSHSSYLLNLASPDAELRKKSIAGFVVELERAEQLGIPFVVLHPGSFTTGSEQQGLSHVIKSLNKVHKQTPGIAARCLLENTAGQGSNLGWRFEQLATLIDGVDEPERLGVCFDTCHAFAAGYALATRDEYEATMRALDDTIGIERVKAIHLNDSKRELGSRVDRHEHIGRGELGLEPFRRLLNDARFQSVPMYLETPKDKDDAGADWDVVNLATLRSLLK